MCFKNLPIEFDTHGKPHLRTEPDPFGTGREVQASTGRQLSHEKIQELLARNGHIRNVDFDPVTRVAGALAFHAVAEAAQCRTQHLGRRHARESVRRRIWNRYQSAHDRPLSRRAAGLRRYFAAR